MRMQLIRLFALVLTSLLPLSGAIAAKYALVIGINGYDNVRPLQKAVNDATSIARVLEEIGYTVELSTDASRIEIIRKWQRLLDKINPSDDVIVFYAGHGVEIDNVNYLVPRDAPSSTEGEEVVRNSLISFPDWIRTLRSRHVNSALWILDACRDNPFDSSTREFGSGRGLGRSAAPQGTFVMYSAAEGEAALDRLSNQDQNPNSVYTRELLPLLSQSELAIYQVARLVKRAVYRSAQTVNCVQQPAYYDGTIEPICLIRCPPEEIGVIAYTATRPPETGNYGTYLRSLQMQNAVFLGKEPLSDQCTSGGESEGYPFGCDVISKLASGRETEIVGDPVTAKTSFNILQKAPTYREKVIGQFACVVRAGKAGDKVSLSEVVKLSHLGNTYYWGLTSGPPLSCLPYRESVR